MKHLRGYKVGFLGAGYIAGWHQSALRTLPQARLVAVCDQSQSRANRFADLHGITSVHSNLDSMLAGEPLDVVHVLLPPEQHFSSARRLLEAGLNVLLEKPMSLRAEECTSLGEQADRQGCALGVSHNFLFSPVYQRLKQDIAQGNLGKLDQIVIVWNKELPQLRAGAFGSWVLRAPGNVVLESGVHSVAHLLDLVGAPGRIQAEADLPITLPSGIRFCRRWLIRAWVGPTIVDLRFSFGRGFSEHTIQVNGSVANAAVDFDRNTYLLRRHRFFPEALDQYALLRSESRALKRQAWKNLAKYSASRLGLSNEANTFGASIAHAMQRFYQELPHVVHPGLSHGFGSLVVKTCNEICRQAGAEMGGQEPARQVRRSPLMAEADVLVLGATGFIGSALVKGLASKGQAVRLLVRDEARLPNAVRELPVEITCGDAGNPNDLDAALRNVRSVYHLAKANVKTWREYCEQDIAVTRAVAEACLRTGVQRLVYTSSIDAYYAGARARTIDERTPLDSSMHRRNPYARCKAESERLLITLWRERRLPVLIFRPGIVLGSGANPFHPAVGFWPWESSCRLWGNGRNPLPTVLVDDVVDALTRGMRAEGVSGEAFNLVGEPLLTAREYIGELEKASGARIDATSTSPWRFYSWGLLNWLAKCVARQPDRELLSYRDCETRSLVASFNCNKAKQMLGWSPTADRETFIREGITKPVHEWLQ